VLRVTMFQNCVDEVSALALFFVKVCSIFARQCTFCASFQIFD
jgi:hypothetical protein